MQNNRKPLIQPFQAVLPPEEKHHRPLLIGCSGGGGHITAINAIAQEIGPEQLEDHQPVPYSQQDYKVNLQKAEIQIGLRVVHGHPASPAVRYLLKKLPLPILPDPKDINKEIETLANKNKNPRKYIDMLLDVYPAGYHNAAIWNVLQSNDQISDLNRLVKFQKSSDRDNYHTVKAYYKKRLQRAQEDARPYTEVISTQAMALPALCDAVKEHNLKYHAQIKIHQYMTDLPTAGAIHFFPTLSRLKAAQRKQMILHATGLTDNIVKKFDLDSPPFAGLVNISPNHNPMVRKGFRDPALSDYNDSRKPCSLKYLVNGQSTGECKIAAHEKVVAIMLGSQAGIATVDYVRVMLEQNYSKIFIFGGNNAAIKKGVDEILEKSPHYKDKIILLENQDDVHMAPIMARSHKIIRGGGLSVMEEMAMPHNNTQVVLVHHKETGESELTSGIQWEDKNVDCLVNFLQGKVAIIGKTSPARAQVQLLFSEALLAFFEDFGIVPDSTLSSTSIARFIIELKKLKADKAHFELLARQLPKSMAEMLLACYYIIAQLPVDDQVKENLTDQLIWDETQKKLIFNLNDYIQCFKVLHEQYEQLEPFAGKLTLPKEATLRQMQAYHDEPVVKLLGQQGVEQVVDSLFSAILSHVQPNQFCKAVEHSGMSRKHVNALYRNFMKYQLTHLLEVYEKSAAQETDLNVTARNILLNMKGLIESNDWKVGFWGVQQIRSAVNKSGIRLFQPLIPKSMTAILGVINQALVKKDEQDWGKVLGEIEHKLQKAQITKSWFRDDKTQAFYDFAVEWVSKEPCSTRLSIALK